MLAGASPRLMVRLAATRGRRTAAQRPDLGIPVRL